MGIIINRKVNEKITRLLEKSEKLEESSTGLNYKRGVYASVELDDHNLNKIWTVLKKIGIPLIDKKRAHVTVMLSSTGLNYKPEADNINGIVEPIGFGIFGKGTSSQPYVLVLKLKSNELVRAHQKWKSKYKLRPAYNKYEPHLTLTYDLNRIFPKMGSTHLTEKQKKVITNIFDKLLPDLPRKLNIFKHTVEPLS